MFLVSVQNIGQNFRSWIAARVNFPYFMSNAVEQIKDKLNVYELVSDYLRLEKAGTNYKALCPFHNEKTPSFMVNPERNFWYCFGCQKGGDIFSFIMEMEGIDFSATLHQLARRANVEIPRYFSRESQKTDYKRRLFSIMQSAIDYYKEQLEKHFRAGLLLKYLTDRKISRDQINLFQIGYAPPGWDGLLNFLVSRGYSPPEIERAGLLVKKGGVANNQPSKNDFYDRFRDRIMFPVFDSVGKPVGFSARLMPDSDQTSAKYINTPVSAIYDKSNVLFGLYQAKTEIRRQNFVVVVEGNLDVIASFAAGVQNVVAISGTALTNQHADILKRYTENVKLCFDMDQAGYNATVKSVRVCLAKSLDVEIITLDEGAKDVNDLVIKDPTLWKNAVDCAKGVMDYFFSTVFSRYDSSNIKGKKTISKELLNIIKDIADPIEKFHWLKKLSTALGIDEEVLTKILEKAKLRKEEKVVDDKNNRQLNKVPRKVALTKRLLGLLSLYGPELEQNLRDFDDNLISQSLRETWSKYLNKEIDDQVLHEINQCATEVKYYYDEREGFVENEIDFRREWESTVGQLMEETKKEQIGKIVRDIKKAEQENDEDALRTLMEKFSELTS